jgi:hypothetical protein
MTDWTSGKIALVITAKVQNGATKTDVEEYLPMQNNFESRIVQRYERIHGAGPGEFNAGIVKKIPAYSFSIDVYANTGQLEGTTITSTARFLRALMLARTSFNILVGERKEVGSAIAAGEESYELRTERFDKCYVTSMDVRNEVEQAPVASFECVAYRFNPSYISDNSDPENLIHQLLEAQLGDGELQSLNLLDTEILADATNLFKWE